MLAAIQALQARHEHVEGRAWTVALALAPGGRWPVGLPRGMELVKSLPGA